GRPRQPPPHRRPGGPRPPRLAELRRVPGRQLRRGHRQAAVPPRRTRPRHLPDAGGGAASQPRRLHPRRRGDELHRHGPVRRRALRGHERRSLCHARPHHPLHRPRPRRPAARSARGTRPPDPQPRLSPGRGAPGGRALLQLHRHAEAPPRPDM
ncbi:MAG: hypothetical protein AVDCRST_MAG31-1432, partial [uncultured Sphingomonas sp.]